MMALRHPEPWTHHALCAQVGGDEWFPDQGQSSHAAKAVCRRCPVIAQCLEYALRNDERHGIFGGLSERERRAMKKART